MSTTKLSPDLLDSLQHYEAEYNYVINQFNYGKVSDPYDAVDLIMKLMTFIKDLYENEYEEMRAEELKRIYFQLGHLADEIVWSYEVHRYYDEEKIVEDLKVINHTLERIYGRKLG